MSYEKFKQLRAGQKVVEEVKNPYKTFTAKKDIAPPIEDAESGKSILNNQNKHLHATVLAQGREIKELKEDIATLYMMLLGVKSLEPLSPQETREIYSEFKEDKRHLINRKIKVYNGSGIEGD